MNLLIKKSAIKKLFILLLAITFANFLNAQTLPAIGTKTNIYILYGMQRSNRVKIHSLQRMEI